MRRPLLPILVAVAALAACGPAVSPEEDGKSQTSRTTLEVIEVAPGSGPEARPGRRVAVHYTGWLYHPDKPNNQGRQFDSSRDRGEPLEFTIDNRDVIPGWDQGITGMKTGGKRTLIIPPQLAYGRQGNPPTIPGNATLVFDVELMAVK